jgi:hypothetical protein
MRVCLRKKESSLVGEATTMMFSMLLLVFFKRYIPETFIIVPSQISAWLHVGEQINIPKLIFPQTHTTVYHWEVFMAVLSQHPMKEFVGA